MSTTVLSSVRTSAEIFLAIALGAVIGIGVEWLGLPSATGVGAVVLIGTLVSQIRWLGASGSWVPIAGLFVLILGHGNEDSFVLGYLGLTTLGAAVGTAVTMVFPPLLLDQTERAQDALRQALGGQLEQLASDLEGGALRDPADAHAVAGELLGHGRAVEDLVGQALEGPPINWRVRRGRGRADHLRRQGAALVSLALLVGGARPHPPAPRRPRRRRGSAVRVGAARAGGRGAARHSTSALGRDLAARGRCRSSTCPYRPLRRRRAPGAR